MSGIHESLRNAFQSISQHAQTVSNFAANKLQQLPSASQVGKAAAAGAAKVLKEGVKLPSLVGFIITGPIALFASPLNKKYPLLSQIILSSPNLALLPVTLPLAALSAKLSEIANDGKAKTASSDGNKTETKSFEQKTFEILTKFSTTVLSLPSEEKKLSEGPPSLLATALAQKTEKIGNYITKNLSNFNTDSIIKNVKALTPDSVKNIFINTRVTVRDARRTLNWNKSNIMKTSILAEKEKQTHTENFEKRRVYHETGMVKVVQISPHTVVKFNPVDPEQKMSEVKAERKILKKIHNLLKVKHHRGIQDTPFKVTKMTTELNQELTEGFGSLGSRYNQGTLLDVCPGKSIEDKIKLLERPFHGMAALHSVGVAQRDIKSKNICVNDGKADLIDFGASCVYDKEFNLETDTRNGTSGYFIPRDMENINKLKNEGKLEDYQEMDFKMDLHAFGTVLYEIFTLKEGETERDLKTPFPIDNRGKINFEGKFQEQPLREAGCPERMIALIKEMCGPSTEKRTTEQLYHEYKEIINDLGNEKKFRDNFQKNADNLVAETRENIKNMPLEDAKQYVSNQNKKLGELYNANQSVYRDTTLEGMFFATKDRLFAVEADIIFDKGNSVNEVKGSIFLVYENSIKRLIKEGISDKEVLKNAAKEKMTEMIATMQKKLNIENENKWEIERNNIINSAFSLTESLISSLNSINFNKETEEVVNSQLKEIADLMIEFEKAKRREPNKFRTDKLEKALSTLKSLENTLFQDEQIKALDKLSLASLIDNFEMMRDGTFNRDGNTIVPPRPQDGPSPFTEVPEIKVANLLAAYALNPDFLPEAEQL